MKNSFLMVGMCGLILLGCSRKTPVEQAFDGVEQSVVELEKALPVECRSDAVLAKIESLRAENAQAQVTCATQIQNYKIKYERLIALFGVVILAYFAKFLIKK